MHFFHSASYKGYVWDLSVIFSDFLKFFLAFCFDGVFLIATVFNNLITYSNTIH